LTDPALTVEQVLTDDLRDWMLAGLRYPVLAVINSEGAPTQSVMWFTLGPDSPDTILMNTKVGRAKERALRRDPRVSLCFADGLTWIALHGRVDLDDDREASLAVIKALAERYEDDDVSRFDGQERVTLRMRVTKVIRHD
jgi:PPOX class probable F420-dependent enzyme